MCGRHSSIMEKVAEWLERADKDVEAAKLLQKEIPEYSAYHSQQAVEKYLKAFLVYKNIDFPKTHNIFYLIDICKKADTDFEYLLEIKSQILTKYAYTRYPGIVPVSREDAKKAIKIAEKVREFVLNKLGRYNY